MPRCVDPRALSFALCSAIAEGTDESVVIQDLKAGAPCLQPIASMNRKQGTSPVQPALSAKACGPSYLYEGGLPCQSVDHRQQSEPVDMGCKRLHCHDAHRNILIQAGNNGTWKVVWTAGRQMNC